MSSYTTCKYCLIEVKIPQFHRLVQKQFPKHCVNNAIQSLHLTIRSWMIWTCSFMQSLDLLKVLLDNAFPQILSIICEYFLWYVIMHIDFVMNEFSNSILCRLGNSLSNESTRRIVNCDDDSSIIMACLRQS